ncbi:MAG: hypothetical protein RJA09_2248 [Pseudomonadota bacterium]
MWTVDSTAWAQGGSWGSAVTTLAVALGCGLLVGIERERHQAGGAVRALAGVRTFALVCVMASGATLTGQAGLVVVGALLVAALCVVSHARDKTSDVGVTTEIALFLTYLMGVLAESSATLAAAMAVGGTALLAGRERLHRFAHHWLRPNEVRDGVTLGALVLIALPLVPNQPLWGEVLNLHRVVQLLALLLVIQSLAYLSRRLLDARHAVVLSSVASGFVSSTATIASMGMAVREGRGGARLMAGAGLLSCTATLLQALVVALAIQPSWLGVLWGPAVAGTFVALLWGIWLVRGATAHPTTAAQGSNAAPAEDRMFSLRAALLVAGLLTGVQALVYGLRLWLGDAGLLGGTILAAVADLHAAMSAVFALGPPDEPGAPSAGVWALVLAVGVHGVSKATTAGLAGGARYFWWLAPGLALHTAVAVVGLWLQR